ncbi:thiol:disulfide interchange protein DsbA/DsbL, partial [Campylobacter jejuni]|nr:thiol:disulfide interchange protein DsbA/DsbL [Campylobacter jejuni]
MKILFNQGYNMRKFFCKFVLTLVFCSSFA